MTWSMGMIKEPYSPLASKQIIDSHNPIQLAAISNYKLAQLTFAPPDLHSLRKTAVVKNMIEDIYANTPVEWLQQMTRWQYFTPESLEEMTQEGLEEIFAQYAQIIETFRPIKTTYQYEDDLFFDDDDEEGEVGDELWIAEEQQEQISKTDSVNSTTSTLFSHPNATLSNHEPQPQFSEKPLPPLVDDTAKQARHKSGFSTQRRLSWTSDTGITSSIVSQNLANEIMSLFDMDFAIDIKLDTAPKLPELPFSKPRRRSQRQSQDMLTSLLPAFEKIALENSKPMIIKPELVIQSVPKRSSSLRNREEITSPTTPNPSPVHKTVSKQKSLLHLASLMTGKKSNKQELPISPESIQCSTDSNTSLPQSVRGGSTSTVNSTSSSSSSSSWCSTEGNIHIIQQQKPLPEIPVKSHKRHSLKRKKKSATLKRSIYEEKKDTNLSRSQSALLKIGLKHKNHKQTIRRSSSAKDLSSQDMIQSAGNIDEMYKSEEIIVKQHSNSFVKRMTSFHWRMKTRHQKPVVEV
ncbi:uncharacterized protein BX663DRAFT_526226 [Cokeromyces recurvatus]|uniref:uncharacterized protein n=1 Tax=Cokeromyces recurvatus TaxID=90255 RepID=UPI00221FBFB6|nr:uncharacterized protein BX663DRAFT_526226 [Cokeromyces recurvatus]KAI7898105.1 hypothetical protein BX663DRAFT_526226 [Cokeromyces recurvatus]